MTSRSAYSGGTRKLVLAFDVGTTFSGISYSVLDPGEVPEIKGVMKFPYQEIISGNFKVPSVIWYDAGGNVQAIGAGALRDGIEQEAEDGQWSKVEWYAILLCAAVCLPRRAVADLRRRFKLYLRPKYLGNDEISQFAERIPLPASKTIAEVLADFFSYLYQSAKAYIQEHQPSGLSLWSSIEPSIEFILSHPNGWEGAQQSQMRAAAIIAGLIPDTQGGRDRIHFVTEGEASLHFCISKGLMTEAIKDGGRVMIVDAGGGTIDISTYENLKDTEAYEEVASPQCILRGSVFVSQYAKKFLEEYFHDSSFSHDVPEMVKVFDKSTKLRFRRVQDAAFIKFGSSRDNDPAHNIRSGQLKLKGEVIATFFKASIDGIIGAILEHRQKHNISAVFLVGGFSASDWVFDRVQAALQNFNIELSRPDSHINKAVADGAVSFYLDRFVSARMSRYIYGMRVNVAFDPLNEEHASRKHKKYVNMTGDARLPDGFDIILSRGARVTETQEFKSPYWQEARSKDSFQKINDRVLCYKGSLDNPQWVDENKDDFEEMCTIQADISMAMKGITPRRGKDGQTYYILNYHVALLFGLTEFKAQLCWTENGVEKRLPMKDRTLLYLFEYQQRLNSLTCCTMTTRQPYSGTTRNLVLAFDVGTTFSGISYRFPYQELISGSCKVPSVIWYDGHGDVKAIGAGAIRDGIEQEAEDGEWSKIEWFKLHLRPKSLEKDEVAQFAEGMPPLPAGKSVAAVFADFLRYLYQSAQAYIEEHHPNGPFLWSTVQKRIRFILSHPNGWEGPQQSQMRQAAILAGLIPDTPEGKSRIHFVTEGEASLHFCISQGLMAEVIKDGERAMVVDAGGGTIDISAYEKQAGDKQAFNEITAPQCKLRGSVFVTQYARKYLEDHLSKSPYLCDVPDIVKSFDKTTKLRFRRTEDPAFIKFGTSRDNDLAHHIRSGGFAASDWLFHSVQVALKNSNIALSRPDNHINKAVADGAVSYYIDHFVTTRVAKFDFGTSMSTDYCPSQNDHVLRLRGKYIGMDGAERLPGAFSTILPKVDEKQEFRQPYMRLARTQDELLHIRDPILCYRGSLKSPSWVRDISGLPLDGFEKLCTIEAQIQRNSGAFSFQRGKDGQNYYRVNYEIILLFGLTEFQAQFCWKENRSSFGHIWRRLRVNPYSGAARNLILAFDVGTTFSGISYSVLDPGQVPETKGVMKFPYQELISGNFKVPSVIWYDADGNVKAIGAGANRDGIEQEAEDGQWTKVDWFKLHMRPKSLENDEVSQFAEGMPPLPPGKSITEVFADFFRYLYQSSQAYIEEHHPNGQSFWSSVQRSTQFVLSHPNGWEGPQQSQMRQAAIFAGLIPDTATGKSRIHFVTEGEASLHFCISQGLLTEVIKERERVMVVDAGGGTIDISTYEKRSGQKQAFNEVAPPQCKLRGSVFVTQYARKYLEMYLSKSSYLSDVPDIVKCFDRTTKLRFSRPEDPAFIKFGTSRDNDPAHNIRSGQLKLKGDEIATFFRSSIECITEAIIDHHRDYGIQAVFLVGGFAASDWLFQSVKAAVKSLNIVLSRPDSHINKAVADGAVSYYIDHFVATRVAKFDLGVNSCKLYCHWKSDHVMRSHERFTDLEGDVVLPDAFDILLPKGTHVNEKEEFRRTYTQMDRTLEALLQLREPILCYKGPLKNPRWVEEGFEEMCTIEAMISKSSKAITRHQDKDGRPYYRLSYEIILLFGLTEFKAQVCWTENGVEKRMFSIALNPKFITHRIRISLLYFVFQILHELRIIVDIFYEFPSRFSVVPTRCEISSARSSGHCTRRSRKKAFALCDLGSSRTMTTRPPYSGTTRSLVLAFDVGTTFSGICYSLLDPGQVPEIKDVIKFPYQDLISGNFKVPSVIWYDAAGNVKAIGAGAIGDEVEQEGEDGQWTKVECSKAYIEEHHPNGQSHWASVQGNIQFVLSHPNGWEGPQQARMREAAILAGLVPDTQKGKSRIHFVTEGEACLHFCISQGLMTGVIKDGERMMVVDAGGGTIDISTYEKQTVDKKAYSEVAAPQCKLRGSVFVTQYARKYLEKYLSKSPFLRDVPDIVKSFDRTTKPRFQRPEDPAFIKFGTARDNDPAHNIRSGRLKLNGVDIATFFQSSIECITKTILNHRRNHDIRAVFLVGGFAASDWLFHSVQDSLKNFDVVLSRPDGHLNKAVADARIAKFDFGVSASIIYNPWVDDHLQRAAQKYTDLEGDVRLPGHFSIILPKGMQVDEKQEFRESYTQLARSVDSLLRIQISILCHKGSLETPTWVGEDFEEMCTIEAMISRSSKAISIHKGQDGQPYHVLRFDVILLFGLTEFKAQFCWTENGVEKR
ncbi:hypothetical protein BDN72DRAFT_861491 [Pluteus cervinus]|uniref:Uncharacterized protein n=1 Tax=Pluteus cervinus TaxID=181527 RepID=A0ACD3AG00_9AGAR|nr:hypothetical protein BDN72DRAFT_861491 [Pluteus cervinus]